MPRNAWRYQPRRAARVGGLAALILMGSTLAGCNNAGGGALVGGGLGAGAGALIGSALGHAGNGSLIGLGVGALGGAIIGDQNERNERRYSESYYHDTYHPYDDYHR